MSHQRRFFHYSANPSHSFARRRPFGFKSPEALTYGRGRATVRIKAHGFSNTPLFRKDPNYAHKLQ